MPPQSLLETFNFEGTGDFDSVLANDAHEDADSQETLAYWIIGSFVVDQKLTDGSFTPTPGLDLNVFRVFLGWYLVKYLSKTLTRDRSFDDLD